MKKLLQKIFASVVATLVFLPVVAFAQSTVALPPQPGHANEFLQTDGLNLRWAVAGGGGTITGGGAVPQVTLWTGATSIGGDSEFTFDTTISRLLVGDTGALFDLNPNTQQATFNVGTNGFLINNGGGSSVFDAQPTSMTARIGDVDSIANDTVLTVNDAGQLIDIASNNVDFHSAAGTNLWGRLLNGIWTLGDVLTTNNQTQFIVDDSTRTIISSAQQSNVGGRAGVSATSAGVEYSDGVGTWSWFADDTAGGTAQVQSGSTIWAWPQVDSTGTQALVSNGAGALGWQTVGTGTIGGTVAATEVAYGSGVNTITSDSTFTRTPSNFTVQALNGGNTAELQVDANTPTINTFASDGTITTTLSMDPTQKTVLNFGNGTINSLLELELAGSTLGYDDGAGNQSGIFATLGGLAITNNDGIGNTTTWAWPTADSQPGDVLTTDGAGNLSFAAGGSVDTSNAISVSVATTTILPGAPTYNNGVSGVGATLTRTGNGALGNIDGQPTIVGDRILVKNQVSTLQNGVYEVTQVGDAGNPYILTRTTDSDLDTEFDDQVVVPTTGTTQVNQIFGQTTETPLIGTDPIVYVTVTNTYVTQSVTGTQTNGNIPFWTNNPRQLNRGNSRLAVPGNTWLNSMLRLGGGTQGGRMVFRSGTNVDNVFIGYNDATTANVFNFNNVSAGGEMRTTIAGTTSTATWYSNSGKRAEIGNTYLSLSPYAVGAGSTMEQRFLELAAGGSNYVGFKAADALAGNVIWTLPTTDSTGTQALVSNGSGTLSWTTVGSGNVTGSGTSPRIPYWSSASALTDDAAFTRLAGQGIALEDSSSNHSIFIGFAAGNNTSTGDYNIAIGPNAGDALTTGNHNLFMGRESGGSNDIGTFNTVLGVLSGQSNTSGTDNTIVGYSAGNILTTGAFNTIVGSGATVATNSTTNGIALGAAATAASNEFAIQDTITNFKFQGDSYTLPTAFPASNGYALTSTTAGTMSWASVGSGLTGSGTSPRIPYWSSSTALTDDAEFTRTSIGLRLMDNSARHNVFIGESTGASTIGSENIAIGSNAMNSLSGSANSNVAIGRDTLTACTACNENTVIGDFAGTLITTGGDNSLFGNLAGQNLTGDHNGFFGDSAGRNVTSGDRNMIFGDGAGGTLTTGDDNTIIGANADVATSSSNNAIAIGAGANAATNEFALPSGITNWEFQGDSYTLPTAFPSSNDQALVSSTAGVMTWGSVVTSGTWTPTLTAVTNVSATTAYDGQYLRVGNVVQASVRVEVDPTIASLTEVGISLPIASNIAGLEGVSGTCADSEGLTHAGGVEGDATNNRGQLGYSAITTTSQSLYCTFGYTIIP